MLPILKITSFGSNMSFRQCPVNQWVPIDNTGKTVMIHTNSNLRCDPAHNLLTNKSSHCRSCLSQRRSKLIEQCTIEIEES